MQKDLAGKKGHQKLVAHRWWFIAELGIVFVELAAPAQELTLVGRHFKFVEDGVHRADWLTIGTIDAHF